MKPAPAMSTLAIAAFGGSERSRASAHLRGFWRVALASRMARLLAKSPCCASRLLSTSTLKARALAGTRSSGKAARASVNNVSIKVFKANPWGVGYKGSVRRTKGRQFTAARARKHLNLLRADPRRSTNAGREGPGASPHAPANAAESAARWTVRLFRSTDARESDRHGAQSRR